MISYETKFGTVTFSENYLAKLIGSGVTSCYGVVGMTAGNSRQRIFDMFSKEQATDFGIKVTGDSQMLDVEIHIIVLYGMNITAIAQSITEKVKYIVSTYTGLEVNCVTVKVDGIKE